MKSRYIFIGDIHGCFTELSRLLDKIGPTAEDEVVSVGDFVGKGPGADRCLMIWQGAGFKAVQGNMDAAFVDWTEGKREIEPGQLRDTLEPLATNTMFPLYLKSLPLFLDYPEIGVTVVHGGLYPDMKINKEEMESREGVIALRYLRKDGKGDGWSMVPTGKQKKGDVFWSELWDGDRMIIYGHTPQKTGKPKVDKQAIGIDLGCVFGGFLTAAIYLPEKGYWDFQLVKAEKQYAPWPK